MKRRIISIFTVLVIICNLLMIQTDTASAATITESEVTSKLSTLINQYNGTPWNRVFAQGKECYAFAHFIFNTIFGRGSAQVGNGAVSSNSKNYMLNNVASDIVTIGILAEGYSAESLENLLEQAAPGDYIQLKRRGTKGPHSVIAVDVDKINNVIWLFDANKNNSGRVAYYSRTFSEFMSDNCGVSLYRYKGYDYKASDTLQSVGYDYPTENQEISSSSFRFQGWVNTTKEIYNITCSINDGQHYITSSLYTREDVPGATAFLADISADYLNMGSNKIAICVNYTDGTGEVAGCRIVNRTWEGEKIHNPVGNLDGVSANEGIIQIAGWAFDEDNYGQQLKIKVYIGGTPGNESSCYIILADWYRPDVAEVYPSAGEWHGFLWSFCVSERGWQDIYVYAVNINGGEDTFLGSTTVNITEEVEENKIEEGIYTIATAVDENKVMDIWEVSQDDYAPLIICDYNGGTNQQFYVKSEGNDIYTISAMHSGKILSIESGGRISNIVQYTDNDGDYQKWKIKSAGDGSYYIISEAKQRHIDLYEEDTTNNSIIVSNYGNGTTAQKWIFNRLVESVKIEMNGGASSKTLYFNEIGATKDLDARIVPDKAANKSVVWSSSNTSVATVSQSGVVTAKGNGNAIITVATEDGEKTDICIVKVLADRLVYGDINSNNTVDDIDLLMMSRAISGIVQLTDEQEMQADLNGDGTLSDADKEILSNFLAGNINSFPVETMLSHIEITSVSDKTLYYEGEEFDSDGLKIVAIYNDGSQKIISDYTLNANTSEIGLNQVSISYSENGVSTNVEFSIEVVSYCEANGHNYSPFIVMDKEATCTEAGSQSNHCTRCDAKAHVETISAKGHVYDTTLAKASVGVDGSKFIKCTVCDDVYCDEIIYGIESIEVSATSFTYTGTSIKPEVIVKNSRGKIIDKSDYTVGYYNNVNVGTATVLVNFKGDYSGFAMKTFEIIADESDSVCGDSNGDNKINVMDAVLIKKHIAGFKGLEINTDACDVNVDGKINVMDAVMVLKYIAGFDVKLGK